MRPQLTGFEVESAPERGAFQVMAAVAVLASFAAGFVLLDLAGTFATRAAVRAVLEGAALAATQELARIYETRRDGGPVASLSPGDKASVIEVAVRYASSGTPAVDLDPADIRFLRRGPEGAHPVQTFAAPDTIEVQAGGAAFTGGKVTTLLASFVGGDAAARPVSGIAGFSPLSRVPEGAIGLPLGISASWFEGRARPCEAGRDLGLGGGSTSGCLRWQVFSGTEQEPASILDRIAEDRFLSPEAVAGVTEWNVLSRPEAGSFESLLRLYEGRKDPSGRWEVLLPVLGAVDCGNTSGPARVVGFASATIYRVTGGSAPGLEAEVSCRILHLGQGGGVDFGTGSLVVLR